MFHTDVEADRLVEHGVDGVLFDGCLLGFDVFICQTEGHLHKGVCKKKGTRLKNQGQAITTSLTDVISNRSAAYFIGSFSCCNLDTSSDSATQEQ